MRERGGGRRAAVQLSQREAQSSLCVSPEHLGRKHSSTGTNPTLCTQRLLHNLAVATTCLTFFSLRAIQKKELHHGHIESRQSEQAVAIYQPATDTVLRWMVCSPSGVLCKSDEKLLFLDITSIPFGRTNEVREHNSFQTISKRRIMMQSMCSTSSKLSNGN